jgi:hypothetical protein
VNWTDRIIFTAILIALGCGLSFLYWPREAPAQCGLLEAEVLAYDDVACVVYDRRQARSLGVPKRLRVRTLVGCLGGKHKNLLVFGLGRRKGQLQCSGYGPVNGPDWAACGIMW